MTCYYVSLIMSFTCHSNNAYILAHTLHALVKFQSIPTETRHSKMGLKRDGLSAGLPKGKPRHLQTNQQTNYRTVLKMLKGENG